MPRDILHVDMDAFYASVEQRDDPQLRGRPVIVGAPPAARGVVSAASYEARVFGVRSAMPSSQAGRLCPQAVFLPVRMARYQEVSRQVMAILRHYTPLLEQISVDEAFLDVTGSRRLFGEAEHIGREIKARIRTELDLPASVGVASNKFVAKIASDLRKPDGFVVVPAGQEAAFLAPLPISRLWGVGKATERRLHDLGLRTIGQLARFPEDHLQRQFGNLGPHLHSLALGQDDRPVETEREAKSVSAETTFAQDIADRALMEATLLRLAEDVGRRVRRGGLRGRTIQLKLRFESFETITRRQTLPRPTDADATLYQVVLRLLGEAPLTGRKVRLLGVGLSGFGEEVQPSLFEEGGAVHSALDEAVDALRSRFGRDAIRRGRLVEGDHEES
ncbi:DNA polymerase IV [bacterium]|nr:DNA polymerase IV [bacterium]